MSGVGFLDLLGVASTQKAAELWPLHCMPLDPADVVLMISELEGALRFENIRPGASGGAVGLWADMTVIALTPTQPIVFGSLPKFGFHLLKTDGGPARIFVQRTATGVELAIEALPVEVRFPDGLLTPYDSTAGDVVQGAFSSAYRDTYEIALNAVEPSSLKTYVKLKISETFDVLLEFATPVSVGPCRFSGIPCAALHDVSLILSPNPVAMDTRAQALEWLRHPIVTPPGSGAIAVRTVDLFSTGSRVKGLSTSANEGREPTQFVEPVLEDLIVLATGPSPVPFPLHFTAGVRRSLGVGEDPNGIYKLGDKPVIVPIVKGNGPGGTDGLYLIVREALIRSFGDEVSLTDPQTAFLDLAFSNDPQALGVSGTVELTDEWTLLAGAHCEPAVHAFSLFGADIQVAGLRAGVSFKRLFKDEPDKSFWDYFVVLGDLLMILGGGSGSTPKAPAKIESKSGKPTTVVINDIGLKFGGFVMGSFWQADEVDLKAAGVLRLSIEEFGFVTEPNGGRYFSFSGTWPIFGTPTTNPEPSGEFKASLGIQFYRLRAKVQGASDAPYFLIDGLGLYIQYKTFSLIGSGMLSDRTEGAVRYREAGLAIELRVGLGDDGKSSAFVLGGQFLYGRANNDSGSVDFRYILAGLKVSPIPITGAISLVNVRGLFAWNMQPRIGPADPSAAQPMRLFDWYKAHTNGVEIPATRNVSASGWEPMENAWALGVGAGVKFGGSNAVTIDAFILYVSSPAAKVFLAALEVYLGGMKPIAYGVVEVDDDHWSTLIGLALGIENAVGRKIPFFDDAVGLTGTFYATNQPATFAIGRLNDTSSWLALRIGGDIWVFKVRLFIGVCLELVDVPDGPHVIAFRLEFAGGTRRCAIGSIDFSLAMQLMLGVWRSESRVSGFIQWLEGSVRINVLYVFRFGASFKVEWAFLGPDPAYRKVSVEVHIHTPWWMPDKTFRWNRTLDQPEVENMSTASCPLLEATASGAVPGDPIPLPVSALSDDPQAVFSIVQLQGLPVPAIAGEIPPVPVDSVVALHFKPAVDDRLLFGQNTPAGASRQESAEMSTEYELVEIGIRRRPLYGPGNSAWSTLIDPAESRIDGLLNNPPDPATVHSPVAMRWDCDFQRQQALDPRHLLLNSELPFRFHLFNFANDENLLRNLPGWPCCPALDPNAGEHVLDFEDQEQGNPAPVEQLFSNSQSIWRWLVAPPVVQAPQAESPFAMLDVAGLAEGAIATVTFDRAAARVDLKIAWKAMHLPRALVISAFRGLKLVDELVLPLDANAPPTIRLSDTNGISHLIVRLTGRAIADHAGIKGSIDFVSARYEGTGELLDALIHQIKCGAFDPATGGNGSRFAWLPNHEYEVRVATRVRVAHSSAGALETEVPQLLMFRTKGLPGLNRAVRLGEEIEPYVETQYPPKGMLLYRSEPAMLAFSERFDILQRLDQPSTATDPPERKQKVDWELVAETVTGHEQPVRLSATDADWIVAHRGTGTGTGPPHGGPKVRPTIGLVRSAPSLDPLRQRFEAVAVSSETCSMSSPPDRRSRVLSHPPTDPRTASGADELWPLGSQVRLNLRIADSPYVDRPTFEEADATSFNTSAAPWAVNDGVLAPSAPGATQQASFGDASWLHLQAVVGISTLGTRAGLAVNFDPTAALIIWVEDAALRIVSSVAGHETELASIATANEAPLTLSVTAFDDEIVARVGSAEVRAPRGEHRAGKLALTADGTSGFTSLKVDGLDAYRLEFDVSRYRDFAEHVGSFGGTIARLPAIGATGVTPADLASEPFASWVSALGVPLRSELDRLEISIHESGVLVIESPEPLGRDVTVVVRQAGNDVTANLVSDERGARLLIVPSAPLAGDAELEFRMSRERYRSGVGDGTTTMAATATLAITV